MSWKRPAPPPPSRPSRLPTSNRRCTTCDGALHWGRRSSTTAGYENGGFICDSCEQEHEFPAFLCKTGCLFDLCLRCGQVARRGRGRGRGRARARGRGRGSRGGKPPPLPGSASSSLVLAIKHFYKTSRDENPYHDPSTLSVGFSYFHGYNGGVSVNVDLSTGEVTQKIHPPGRIPYPKELRSDRLSPDEVMEILREVVEKEVWVKPNYPPPLPDTPFDSVTLRAGVEVWGVGIPSCGYRGLPEPAIVSVQKVMKRLCWGDWGL